MSNQNSRIITVKAVCIFRKTSREKKYKAIGMAEDIEHASRVIENMKQPGEKYFISPGLMENKTSNSIKL